MKIVSSVIVTENGIKYYLIVEKNRAGYFVCVRNANGFSPMFVLPSTRDTIYNSVEEALESSRHYLTNKYNQIVMPFERRYGQVFRPESRKGFRIARDLNEPSHRDVVVFILNDYDNEDDYYCFYANDSDWEELYDEELYLQLPVISKKVGE